MPWRLWLDDWRDPTTEGFIVARSYNEAVNRIKRMGCPSYVAFDYSLGTKDTGLTLAKWLIERDKAEGGTFMPKDFASKCITDDTWARGEITRTMKEYLDGRNRWKLWLDDQRDPPAEDFVVARSYNEAVKAITEKGCPSYASFDFTLGTPETGMTLVKWLIEKDTADGGTFIPKDFTFDCHSDAEWARVEMKRDLDTYLAHRDSI